MITTVKDLVIAIDAFCISNEIIERDMIEDLYIDRELKDGVHIIICKLFKDILREYKILCYKYETLHECRSEQEVITKLTEESRIVIQEMFYNISKDMKVFSINFFSVDNVSEFFKIDLIHGEVTSIEIMRVVKLPRIPEHINLDFTFTPDGASFNATHN